MTEKYPAGSVVIHFGDMVAVSNPGKVSMILLVALILSGLFNAHTFNVGKTLAHSLPDRVRWRMQIYFMKFFFVILMSPLLEKSLDLFASGVDGGMTKEMKRQTCALTRAFVVLLLAGIGSYSKVFREDSIRREAERLETSHAEKTSKKLS
eukprot:CAMPEP_0176426632 /NCGR_PEP_ID=MMETSP0127-20121128/12059_1 /TAXON_ID=938130 /ORGANISM="Platyophrya macrostoma, Strain WH" /LENGTH=150 /DNA_ID=CAMNT_0017807939 /DNA_START=124 /DNA_END=576 /DNA_ORIENTATION=+